MYRTVLIEDLAAKLPNNTGVGFTAGLLHLPAQVISLDQQTAEIGQDLANKALTTGKAARQSYPKHSASFGPGPPSSDHRKRPKERSYTFFAWRSASSTVLVISMAMVKGPTPPGTGL